MPLSLTNLSCLISFSPGIQVSKDQWLWPIKTTDVWGELYQRDETKSKAAISLVRNLNYMGAFQGFSDGLRRESNFLASTWSLPCACAFAGVYACVIANGYIQVTSLWANNATYAHTKGSDGTCGSQKVVNSLIECNQTIVINWPQGIATE